MCGRCPAGHVRRRPTARLAYPPRDARLHRPDRHPVPDLAVRRGRLPRASLLAMAIESAMIPLPSELILPFAGLPRLGPGEDRAADERSVELLDRGRRRDAREHARVAHRLRDRGVGRPAVPRAVRQVPPDPAARDRDRRAILRPLGRPDRVLQPPAARSCGRSSASPPAWRACRSGRSSPTRPRARSSGRRSSTWAGVQLGERWEDIRHALQPFDLLIVVVVVAGLASPALASPGPSRPRAPRLERSPARGRRPAARPVGPAGRSTPRPARRPRSARQAPGASSHGDWPGAARCEVLFATSSRPSATCAPDGQRITVRFPWPWANRRR